MATGRLRNGENIKHSAKHLRKSLEYVNDSGIIKNSACDYLPGRSLEMIDIETTLAGEIGGIGVMFDIRAKSNKAIRIRSFTFHAKDQSDNCKVKVYTKSGTHRTFETNEKAWTKIVDTVMECKGAQTDSIISSSMFDPSLKNELIVEANSIRAIYIDSHDNYLKYSLTDNPDEIFSEDKYVQIFEGTGLSGEFNDLHNPRMWNGLFTYELVTSVEKGGCASSISTPLNNPKQTYGHMFDIGSDYPDGIIVEGIEFQTNVKTMLNYEIYTIESTYRNFMSRSISDWNLVAKGSIAGGGSSVLTKIAGNDFTPFTIGRKKTRGFYITLDTQNLRYEEKPGHELGDIFASNDHISLAVGVSVPDYPLGESFYFPRQWGGKVLYRTRVACPEPIFVEYIYEVQYPISLHRDNLFGEVDNIVHNFLLNFLETDPNLKSVEKESGNSISLLSIKTDTYDGSSSSCKSPSISSSCDVLVTRVDVGYFTQSNAGDIKYLLLQQSSAVSKAIAFGSSGGNLNANYVGDKAIDTKTELVLKGVKSSTMRQEEGAYLGEVVKSFLNKNLSGHGVEVLRVRVIGTRTPTTSRLLIESRDHMVTSRLRRSLESSTYDIAVQVGVFAKHRPPPAISFNSVVDDAINSKPEELRNDLASERGDNGAQYFREIQEIAVIPSNPSSEDSIIPANSNRPSLSPSFAPRPEALTSNGNNEEGGLGTTMLIVIITAVVTLGLFFGLYVVVKAVRKKRNSKTEGVTDNRLFEEPIFDSIFQHKDYGGDSKLERTSGTSTETMGSSSFHNSGPYPSDSERKRQAMLGRSNTDHDFIFQEGSYIENKVFYDQHRPSLDHTRPNDFDNVSTASSSRTGRSHRREYSPSGRSRVSVTRRTRSPSDTKRKHYNYGRSVSSQRNRSPSGKAISSRRARSPSDRSISSRRTRSPSGRSMSRRKHSPVVSASIKSMLRSEGSICSKDSRMAGNRIVKPGYKAVHGFDPPARRKKPNSKKFNLENEDDERTGLVRISTKSSTNRYLPASSNKQTHNIANNRSSSRASTINRHDESLQKSKLVRRNSEERSIASHSSNSTISTKGRAIPGKMYR